MIILAPGGGGVGCARVHVCVHACIVNTYGKRSRRVIGLNKTQFHFPELTILQSWKTDTKIGHHISEVANPAPRRIGQARWDWMKGPSGMNCNSEHTGPIQKRNLELSLLDCCPAVKPSWMVSLWFLKSNPNIVFACVTVPNTDVCQLILFYNKQRSSTNVTQMRSSFSQCIQ